jgi:hypothetical protein
MGLQAVGGLNTGMLRKSMKVGRTTVQNRTCIDNNIVGFPPASRDGAPEALLVAEDVLTRQLGAMQGPGITGCVCI